jgi:serine/threonine protein kinase
MFTTLSRRVLDSAGYIKIVDYGFCKKLPNNSTSNTMCGTPEYIPPEMVRSKPHTRAVDLWSFGVFLYELTTRATPFEHNETVWVMYKGFSSLFSHCTLGLYYSPVSIGILLLRQKS